MCIVLQRLSNVFIISTLTCGLIKLVGDYLSVIAADGSNVIHHAWNAEDRLASVTLLNGMKVMDNCDVDGQRVQQSFGLQSTNYLWNEASQYRDEVMEKDGSGSIQASYVVGGTEPLSRTRGGAT
jgi:hypothetical protein